MTLFQAWMKGGKLFILDGNLIGKFTSRTENTGDKFVAVVAVGASRGEAFNNGQEEGCPTKKLNSSIDNVRHESQKESSVIVIIPSNK